MKNLQGCGMTFAVKYLLFAPQPLHSRKTGREKSTSHTFWACPFDPLSRRSRSREITWDDVGTLKYWHCTDVH